MLEKLNQIQEEKEEVLNEKVSGYVMVGKKITDKVTEIVAKVSTHFYKVKLVSGLVITVSNVPAANASYFVLN